MSDTIEYLCWAPDRETFVTAMLAQRLPGDRPICRLPEDDEALSDGSSLVWIDGIACHEIGAVVKTPAVYDDAGNEVEPAVMVEGYHVNLMAYGWLAEFLDSRGGWSGIVDLLGEMEWQASEVGEPEALAGTSGVKIYPAMAVNHRAATWAGV